MTPEEKRKLFDLCCKGKKGEYLSPEDIKFCEKMLKKHLNEYLELEKSKEFYEATKPYGAF